MISNERPSPYGRRPYGSGNPKYQSYSAPRKPLEEDTLRTETLQIERKTFIFMLKENPRGRFLRITEGSGDKRNSIIVPATGLADFQNAVEEIVKASAATPEKTPPPQEQPPLS